MVKNRRALAALCFCLVALIFVSCSTLFSPAPSSTTAPSSPPATTTSPPVVSPPIIQFSVTPTGITPQGTAILSWNVNNASTVVIDRGIGPVALSGTRPVSPDVSTVYTMTAANPAGAVSSTVTLAVAPVAGPPAPPPQPGAPFDKDWAGSRHTMEYHYPGCSIAQNIPLPSKVWFDTVAQAKAAGYHPCVVCKPPK
jgi:hypothetical protein